MEPEQEEIVRLAEKLGAIAKTYNLPIYTCAEAVDLIPYGIYPGACIDREKVERISGIFSGCEKG